MASNKVIINSEANSVVISEPVEGSRIVKVIAAGPQGARGEGFNTVSASLNTRLDSLETFSSSLDATFATDAQLTSLSSSVSSSIGRLSASIAVTDLSQNTRLDSLETSIGGGGTGIGSRVSSLEVESGSIRSTFNTFTSSYTIVSTSLDSRLDNLESFSSSLDTSFATDIELAAVSASLSASAAYVSSSISSSIGSLSGSVNSRITSVSSSLSASIGSLSGSVDNRITTLSSSIDSRIISVSSSLSASITQLSASFDNRVLTLSSSLSASINTLSGSLSGSITLLSSSLSASINSLSSSVDARILSLSSSISASINSLSSSVDNRILTLSSSLSSSIMSLSQSVDNRLDSIEAVYATTGSNTFVGNQIVSGNLNVNGSVTATEFYTTFVSSSILYTSGSTKFGDTSDDVMSVTGSIKVTGSISASTFVGLGDLTTYSSSIDNRLNSLSASSGYIQYVTNSIEQLTGIEVADFDSNVAVTFTGGTLKFIFGTPTLPSSIAASLSGFATDRFNRVTDAYTINGSWNNGGYSLVSASLYEGTTLLTKVGTGTSLSYSDTTSGSHTYRLEYTASSPLDGSIYQTSTTTTGTVSKTNPASPTITPSVSVQLGATSNQIEQGATGSITFTSSSANPSNSWNLTNVTTNVGSPYFVTGSATGSTSISITATANYASPTGDNSPDLTTTSTATTTYTKIRSLRYGASSQSSFTAPQLEDVGAWDTSIGGTIGTIAKGTTTVSGQSVTITWTGDKYHYIVFNSSLSNLSNITTSGFGVLGSFSVSTVGQYKVYKSTTLQSGGAGSSITYVLT